MSPPSSCSRVLGSQVLGFGGRWGGVGDARVKLSGHRGVSVVPVHGWRAVLFGLPFLVCGVGTAVAAALGMGSSDAPPELVVLGGVVFALGGLVLMVHGVRGVSRAKRLCVEQELRPHEPWAWDYDWDPRGIDARGSHALARWGAASAAATVLLVPLHLGLFDPSLGALVLPLWLGVVDLGWIAALVWTARVALQRRKFGSPRLSYAHFPFRAGEVVEVYVEGVRGLEALERLDCSLRFIEEQYEATGSNGAYQVNSYQLYCEERSLELRMSGPIQLRFSLPESSYATRLSERPARYWELALHGGARGLDFSASFVLPIYEKA